MAVLIGESSYYYYYYINIAIFCYRSDRFTFSSITSAVKHQWPFVFQAEVRELPTIYSNQEETGTRLVLYLHHAAALGYNTQWSEPLTHIFVILLYHAQAIKLTIYLNTGSWKHRQLVNLCNLAMSLGEDCCAMPLFFCCCRGLCQYLQKEEEGGSAMCV